MATFHQCIIARMQLQLLAYYLKPKKILYCLFLVCMACIYFYGIFYSNSALYMTIPESSIMTSDRMNSIEFVHSTLAGNVDGSSNVTNTGRGGSGYSRFSTGRDNIISDQGMSSIGKGTDDKRTKEKQLKLLRSLPHLRVVNTLYQETKYNAIQKKKEIEQGEKKEANARSSGANLVSNDNGTITSANSKSSSQQQQRDMNQNLLNDTIEAFIIFLSFTLLLRFILAILIYRNSRRESICEIFRTIPIRTTRTRNHTQPLSSLFQQQPHPQQQQQQRIRGGRRTIQQQIQLLAIAHELNRRRVSNGSQPINIEALSTILSNRDFSSTDYESLLELQELNGSSSAVSQGVTDDEIRRRSTIRNWNENDIYNNEREEGGAANNHITMASAENYYDEEQNIIVQSSPCNDDKTKCVICLDQYKVGHDIRTLPCLHSYHVHCIDPWLRQKGSCPICKSRIV